MTAIDDIDRKIIGMLADDARQPLTEVAARVGLSTSAVNDRVRRLVAQGVIRRFTLDASPEALGLPVLALIWVAVRHAQEPAFRAFAAHHPGITECHHVTGPWSYLVHVRAPGLEGVESFLTEMKDLGFLERSETMLALSSIRSAPLVPR
ncbi:Lrp/AsnC family transcriptional regulator [Cereibacter sphaeroides]|uniref:Lrp/AsnC family transcriptional regulator n=1 Tax=Cereibacter sphaeroides TaxID=1063 RepID=UPI002278FFAF|nr:Lrp/AsnC family transcriptional regulator [Cereibacter sphaeroides]MCE6961722.1 Lrp/AsnC family transcriptional regulator [Cereibacter sphaeroides]MCE6970498.1 Lrp/AsnC family transcriptional regulator [Cereibacter sphaeroides]MCE6975072.1 Lrp/AsnC family transcriptional regulator [Cereibacter sphaeroides]